MLPNYDNFVCVSLSLSVCTYRSAHAQSERQAKQKNNGKNSCDFSVGKLKSVFSNHPSYSQVRMLLRRVGSCLIEIRVLGIPLIWKAAYFLPFAENSECVRFGKYFPIEIWAPACECVLMLKWQLFGGMHKAYMEYYIWIMHERTKW